MNKSVYGSLYPTLEAVWPVLEGGLLLTAGFLVIAFQKKV